MRLFGKVLLSTAALALAGALSMGAAQAAPIAGKVAVSSQLDLVAMKKMVHKKKVKKHSAKKTHPGGCGTMMYYDKKTGTCANAMTKKTS